MTLCVVEFLVHEEEEICVCGKVCKGMRGQGLKKC